MAEKTRHIIRAAGRRPSDGKKFACLMAVSEKSLVDADAMRLIASGMATELGKVGGEPVKALEFRIGEQIGVEVPLTQADIDSDPVWAEAGFKVGETYTDWVTVASAPLEIEA